MPFLKFILKFMKNWEFFRFWKLIFKYIWNFKKKIHHFLKKIITFSKIWNFQNFPIFSKKKSRFFQNPAKSSKIFRNFEISKKLRIFQILKFNFQIYRKFQKKFYHFFKSQFFFKKFPIFLKKKSHILKKNWGQIFPTWVLWH